MKRQVPSRVRTSPQRPASPAAPLDVLVTALGGRGDGVARLETGEVVLIAGGVPGDEATIVPTHKQRGVLRGRIVQLTVPSPHRTAPRCEVAGLCGGCVWQHVDLALQRQEKATLAQRAIGKNPCDITADHRTAAYGHRRRVRLHVRRQNGKLVLGMMLRESDAVAATLACPTLEPALEALLPRLQRALQTSVAEGEIYAVCGVEGAIASLHARPLPGAPRLLARDLAEETGLVGVELRLGAWHDAWGAHEVTLAETAGALAIRCDAEGFCQASADANRAIREAVAKALEQAGRLSRVQEFYAGSGNLTALLLGHVPDVRSVEVNEAAVVRARVSLSGPAQAQGTRLNFFCGDAAHLAEPPQKDELWLLDPGRPGARELCEQAAQSGPAHIVYVSCALDTLARDLRTLEAGGYRCQSAVAIDAFPHTPHLEMVVRLARQLDGSSAPC